MIGLFEKVSNSTQKISVGKDDQNCLTDPVKKVQCVVNDDFFPEMAVVFNEVQVEVMLLVGGL
jgi:hypothetical protein